VKVDIVGCSQDTTYTIQSARCTWTSRWLLPESRWLVITEHTQCWSGLLRLSVECLYQSGEYTVYMLHRCVQLELLWVGILLLGLYRIGI